MLRGPRRSRRPALAFLSVALLIGFASCKKTETAGKKEAGTSETPAATEQLTLKLTAPSVGPDLPAQVTQRIGESSNLSGPRGLTVNKSGTLFVADTRNYRVVAFDPSGRELFAFGKKGTGNGEFQMAAVLATTPDDKIAVLDSQTCWIQIFDAKGKFVTRVGGPKPGCYSARGLAVGKDGTFYVADTGNSRVFSLSPGGELKGTPLKTAGEQPLDQPTDVSIDAQGGVRVYQPIGPKGVGLLFNFSASLAYQSTWLALTSPSTGDSARFAGLPDGRLCASDAHLKRVVLFSANGASLNRIRLEGPLAAPLNLPAGIAADAQGRVFLADSAANTIYCFKP